MTQTTLTDHGIPVDRRAIPSATSDRIYYVVMGEDHKPHCTDGNGGPGCEHSRYHSVPCRHELEFLNQKAEELIAYLRTRYEQPSSAWFASFDHLLSHYRWQPDMEFNIIFDIYLAVAAADGSVSSDDIHRIVGDRFVGDPRKIGAVQHSLVSRGHLRQVRLRPSERDKCHHRRIWDLEITPDGLALLKGMT